MKFSTFLALLFIIQSVSSHSPNSHSHARRSIDILKRQGDLLGGLGNGLGLGGNSPPSAPSNTVTTMVTPPSSLTHTAPPTITSSPTSTSNSDGGGLVGGVVDGLGGVLPLVSPVTGPLAGTSTTPASSVSTSSSSSSDGLLGGGVLGPVVSPLTSALLGPPTTPSSSAPASPSSSSDGLLGGGVLGPVVSPLTSVLLGPPTTPSSSAPASPSSSSDGLLGGVLGPVVSPLTSVLLGTPTTPSSFAPASPSSSSDGLLGGVLGPLAPLTSALVPAITSVAGPVGSAVNSVGSAANSVGSAVNSVIETAPSAPLPIITPVTSAAGSIVATVTGISLQSDSGTSSIIPPTDNPPITFASTLPSSVPDVPSSPPSSIPSNTILSFPTATVTHSIISPVTSVRTTSTTVAIDPNISFILTVSSLVYASTPTNSVANSITNPDQVTGTALAQTSASDTTVPLPTGIPARILPKDQLSPDKDLTGYTFIAILFNQELNWPFVVNNAVSSTQIFAYVPIIIATALGISGATVLTWALQVYIPTTYHTPTDAAQLGTLWLGYVPADLANTLAAQIKAKQSKFYTGSSDVVAQALASHVSSGFSLFSIADPNAGGAKGTASSGNGDKTRQDAIIGVVSALGAIALLVLVFLVYRMMKRRHELAHRRLSDPPDVDAAGIRPVGREFDQDSLGGARRRSFYYAEDSLKGFQGERPDELAPIAGPSMSQRRPLAPGTMISAPILQESSLNW